VRLTWNEICKHCEFLFPFNLRVINFPAVLITTHEQCIEGITVDLSHSYLPCCCSCPRPASTACQGCAGEVPRAPQAFNHGCAREVQGEGVWCCDIWAYVSKSPLEPIPSRSSSSNVHFFAFVYSSCSRFLTVCRGITYRSSSARTLVCCVLVATQWPPSSSCWWQNTAVSRYFRGGCSLV